MLFQKLILLHNMKRIVTIFLSMSRAENVGKWLGFIGCALILSAALFFLDDYVHNHFIFIAGEVVLLGGLVFGFGKIYFVVKEAQKNPKKKK